MSPWLLETNPTNEARLKENTRMNEEILKRMETPNNMNLYQTYIHTSRYARYRDDLGRRETWDETVNRLHKFWFDKIPESLRGEHAIAMREVESLSVMPSMRVLMTAGKALDDHHVAAYNCAYTPIDSMKKFSEILYILMCGTGVGFSVEREYVNRLPTLPEEFHESDSLIVVKDSKLGWAVAYKELIQLLCGGRVPRWDVSNIRPAGSRLKTFGGRASGPAPLEALFRYTCEVFKAAAGRQLTTLECHDIVCKIAAIVVVGGVRRSALISLSNLTDERLRNAKSSANMPDHRYLSNNSVAYTCQPDMDSFLKEMVNLYQSRSGERGIFSRYAAREKYSAHRRDEAHDFGCNPCSEILLRPDQFCNLTEVIVRSGDDIDRLKEKVRSAVFLGTLQSTLTSFKFLSKSWRTNCEEERLLGVSLTGICDHPLLSDPHGLSVVLEQLRDYAVECNREFAGVLGVEPSAAITCVKPSGTVSQLCDTASGIHSRYSEYYIRRVRQDDKDPLSKFLIEQGVPWEQDVHNPHAIVFSFPIKAPEGSVTRNDRTALEQLKLWEVYNDSWCEHKPSITVFYEDEEFLELISYVYSNFDKMSGISFLPKDNHVYAQAPYEEITKEQYEESLAKMPKEIDWLKLKDYETGDNTSVQPELACTAGACEL